MAKIDACEFPTYEEMGKKVAEKALDEFLYNGKTIREWMQIIASEDAISRQEALEKAIHVPIAKVVTEDKVICRKVVFVDDIENLPPVNSQESEPCDFCKDIYPDDDILISRQEALASIKALYPDMPVMDIFGARRKWLEKYTPYFECENAIEQLQPKQETETVTEFADRCRECGAKYGKLFDQKTDHWNIPFLIHKELEIPIYEAQKAYEVAIDYLRNQAYVRG